MPPAATVSTAAVPEPRKRRRFSLVVFVILQVSPKMPEYPITYKFISLLSSTGWQLQAKLGYGFSFTIPKAYGFEAATLSRSINEFTCYTSLNPRA
jgi:hypothetical protein